MEPLKPFTFLPVSMFTTYERGSEREEMIMYRGEQVGYISQFPVETHGQANVWATIFIYLYGSVYVRHRFKNRFYTIDEAKTWLLSKQLSIFDQYTIIFGE